MLRLVREEQSAPKAAPRPIPFPSSPTTLSPLGPPETDESTASILHGIGNSADNLLFEIDSMSRRMDDLAQQLNCFGHFGDENDEGPHAA